MGDAHLVGCALVAAVLLAKGVSALIVVPTSKLIAEKDGILSLETAIESGHLTQPAGRVPLVSSAACTF